MTESTTRNIIMGYKQSEVGVIPEAWEVRRLSDCATLERGKFSARPRNDPKYFGGDYPFVQTGDIANTDMVVKKFSQTLNHKGLAVSKLFPQGTLFFTIAANIGDLAFASVPMACPDSLIGITTKPITDKYWLYHELKSRKSHLESVATQNAQLNINLEKLNPYLIPLPPLPEQKRIAQVLGDVDALIQKLEALIAKKRDIKQAAMQELLTGKRRLPGFNGPWETKKLPEVCWFQEGPGVRTHQFTSSGVKLLNGTNISDGKLVLESTNRFIAESEANGWYSHFLVDTGDILIACSGITIEKFDEKVTEAEEVHLPLCMNTSTMRFKVTSPNLIKSYLKHFLKSDSFKDQISGKATGSAQLNFGPSHVMKVQISLPSSSEQTAIAQVLSDMDNALAQLETRLGKTRDLKAGLMQQLLTGKIRLRVESYA